MDTEIHLYNLKEKHDMKLINYINKLIRKQESSKIKIEGYVEITNGSNHIVSKNSIVDQGLLSFVNLFSCNSLQANNNMPAANWSLFASSMRIGSDAATPTSNSMASLVTPIGAGIGTVPNSQSLANSNPSNGVWQATYTCVWNAGSVSGTLGEAGLFFEIWTAAQGLQPPGGTAAIVSALLLFSRLSSADGKFSSFSLDNTKPLSITWILRFTYTA